MDAPLSAAFDAFAALLMQIAFAYGMTSLFPMRRKGLFWAFELTLWPLAQFMGASVVAFAGGTAAMLVSWVVLPFVLVEESPLVKVLAICAALGCMMVSEAVGQALWGIALGGVASDYETLSQMQRGNLALYLLMDVVIAGLLALMLSALRLVFRRKMHGLAASWPFALLMATQVLLLILAMLMPSYEDVPVWWCVAEVVAAVVCLALDIAALVAVRRYERKLLDDQRAELLEAQLSEYLNSYTVVTRQLEEVARIRHDLRNQLQVVEFLLWQGEGEKAQTLLGELRERCEEAAAGRAGEEGFRLGAAVSAVAPTEAAPATGVHAG